MKLRRPRRGQNGRTAGQVEQTADDIGPASFLGAVMSSLRPYRRRIFVALVVLLAGLATTLAGPALVGWMINDGLVHHRSMPRCHNRRRRLCRREHWLFHPHPRANPNGLGHRRDLP